MRYRWWFNGQPVAGGTNSALTVDTRATAVAGDYTVTVSHDFGVAVNSQMARVSVVPFIINRQPQSRGGVYGQEAIFSVNFRGTPGPEYSFEWRLDGVPLASGPDTFPELRQLRLTDLRPQQEGNYDWVLRAGPKGTPGVYAVTSAVARLTLSAPPAPVFTRQPVSSTFYPGGRVALEVAVESLAPYTLQWFLNATNRIPNATGRSLSFYEADISRAGDYFVVASNAGGSVTSQVARLSLVAVPAPVILSQPQDQRLTQGTPLRLSVGQDYSIPVSSFQWRFNGQPIPGATTADFQRSPVSTNHAGNYDVILANASGSVTSRVAKVTVSKPPLPIITEFPLSRYAAAGGETVFAVNASSRFVVTIGNSQIVYNSVIYYQWYFAGQPLAGETNRTLVLTNLQLSATGEYHASVANDGGAVASRVARLTVFPAARPGITRQPADAQSRAGERVDLSVDVSGSPPLTFQWRHAGTNLPGATQQLLTLPYARPFQAGDYAVVVGNVSGAVTSQVARVEVTGMSGSRLSADVDGDGHNDLVFQHKDGAVGFWHMDGARLKHSSLLNQRLPSNKWRVIGMAQAKQDGHPDLLIDNPDAQPGLAVWNLAGTNLMRGVQVPAFRRSYLFPVSFRDLDGDGAPDVIQQYAYSNFITGFASVVWHQMDGILPVAERSVFEVENIMHWRVAGTGDLDGDGTAEVVLQQKGVGLAVWYLANGALARGVNLAPALADPEWTMKAVVDLDGNGKDDLVFQHTKGTLAVWFMDGAHLSNAAYLEPSSPGAGWELMGPK